jgi:hypothetical protein
MAAFTALGRAAGRSGAICLVVNSSSTIHIADDARTNPPCREWYARGCPAAARRLGRTSVVVVFRYTENARNEVEMESYRVAKLVVCNQGDAAVETDVATHERHHRVRQFVGPAKQTRFECC